MLNEQTQTMGQTTQDFFAEDDDVCLNNRDAHRLASLEDFKQLMHVYADGKSDNTVKLAAKAFLEALENIEYELHFKDLGL